jgi:hypothetical protein
MRWLINRIERYAARRDLKFRLSVLGVPYWPWDSDADLRRRLDCAMMYGYPSERADSRWLATVEGHMMMAEVRLMRALGMVK